jgi:hypothetical protein
VGDDAVGTLNAGARVPKSIDGGSTQGVRACQHVGEEPRSARWARSRVAWTMPSQETAVAFSQCANHEVSRNSGGGSSPFSNVRT